MASDWLAAVLPADQMPGLKTFLNGNFLVAQALVIFMCLVMQVCIKTTFTNI